MAYSVHGIGAKKEKKQNCRNLVKQQDCVSHIQKYLLVPILSGGGPQRQKLNFNWVQNAGLAKERLGNEEVLFIGPIRHVGV